MDGDVSAQNTVYYTKYKAAKEQHKQLQQQMHAKDIEITRLTERCFQREEQNKQLQEELKQSRQEYQDSITQNTKKDIELVQLRELRDRWKQGGVSSDLQLQQQQQEILRLTDLTQHKDEEVSRLQDLLHDMERERKDGASDDHTRDLVQKVERLEQQLSVVEDERDTEIGVYKARADIFEKDFLEERQDREKQNDIILELREAAEQLQTQLLEQRGPGSQALVRSANTTAESAATSQNDVTQLIHTVVRLSLAVAPWVVRQFSNKQGQLQ